MWLASCGDAADCCALPVKAKTWTGVQSAGSRNRSTLFHFSKKIWRTLETQISQDYYVGDMQKESHVRYNTEGFFAHFLFFTHASYAHKNWHNFGRSWIHLVSAGSWSEVQ